MPELLPDIEFASHEVKAPTPTQDGIAMFGSILTDAQLERWTSRIGAQYERLEKTRHPDRVVAAADFLGIRRGIVATASSFTVGTVLSDEELRPVLAGIVAGPVANWVQEELRNRFVCDLDQAWVRRQYAPAHYPPWHTPHAWHQDGALRFDFLAHCDGQFPPESLLSMVTCWIALGQCGADAPGLELVTRRLENLFPPGELTNDRVRAGFKPEEFWRPVFRPGDALLFRGDILHRTHVTPSMTEDRTSIELRFFPANKVPPRLEGDRFIPLD